MPHRNAPMGAAQMNQIEIHDGDATLAMQPTDLAPSNFMLFWTDLNVVCDKYRLPEILYGEARDLYSRRPHEWTE